MKEKEKSKVVFVIGMDRSGTSAMAGMLHYGGIHMGDELKEATQFNPKGFFEDEHGKLILNSRYKAWRFLRGQMVEMYRSSHSWEDAALEEYFLKRMEGKEIWGAKLLHVVPLFGMVHRYVSPHCDIKLVYCRRGMEGLRRSIAKTADADQNSPVEEWEADLNRCVTLIGKDYDVDIQTIWFGHIIHDPQGVQLQLEKWLGVDLGNGYKFIDPELNRHGV